MKLHAIDEHADDDGLDGWRLGVGRGTLGKW